jgi:hypothetical protein
MAPEFEYGDEVHCVLNGDVWGIVIGWDAHKIVYDVQLSPNLGIVRLHGCVLYKIEGGEAEPGGRERAPSAVIEVDFAAKRRKEA